VKEAKDMAESDETAFEPAPVGRRRIYWIGGSKGGVGKSMVAMATIDFLVERGEDVFLVDCDSSNPDVWKAYREIVPNECADLDQGNGWIHLINLCAAQGERTVVVNTAARNNRAVTQFGGTLDGALGELGRDLVTLWVINRQRDSVELLREFMDAMPHALVHVVRNGYFGEESQFEIYQASKTRAVVEERGGRAATFPDLADRVADDLYTKRLAIAAAAKTLPIGNRAELSRWRGEVRRALTEVLA
jgi:hypothetical protein